MIVLQLKGNCYENQMFSSRCLFDYGLLFYV